MWKGRVIGMVESRTACDFLDVVQDQVHQLIVTLKCASDCNSHRQHSLPFTSIPNIEASLRIQLLRANHLFLAFSLTLSASTEFDLDLLVHVLVQVQNIFLLGARCLAVILVVVSVVLVLVVVVAASTTATVSSSSSACAAAKLTAF